MKGIELAVDLGSAFTTIYQKDKGIVVREPSTVVVQNGTISSSVVAIGNDCEQYYGRESNKLAILNPINEGTIVDVSIATKMLTFFFNKIWGNVVFKPKTKVYLVLPCGVNNVDKKAYEMVAYGAGASDVLCLNSSICSVFGIQGVVSEAKHSLVIDIGSTTTDIGVVDKNGIVTGCTINVGAKNISSQIIKYLQAEHSLDVTRLQAEKIKIRIASLYKNDNKTINVKGRDAFTREIRPVMLSSSDILNYVEYYYNQIIEVVNKVYNMLPDLAKEDIKQIGLYLCGGGSKVAGIEPKLYEKMGLHINIVDEPECATILGAGELMNDSKLIDRLSYDK